MSASLQSPARTPSSYSAFHLPSSSSSSDGDDDDAPLPFPAALPRSDFLAPNFHPASYLSALPHRHQTLDDLRTELRDRSAAISAELLELVNSNYTAFLSLGNDLKGGDEKVEDVKVAMLGFRRAVEEVKGKVRARGQEAQTLSGELRDVRRDIETGRRMLELDERLSALEERLSVVGTPGKTTTDDGDWGVGDSDESEDEDGALDGLVGSSPAKLASLAEEYCIVDALADGVGRDSPFVIKVESRMMRCRNTILIDLGTALKESRKAGGAGRGRVVRYLGLYGMLDAEADAIKALKSK